MRSLLPLDDPLARDAGLAGHKAAGLARATAAGLPVLPGWVVPAEAGRRVVEATIRGVEGAAARRLAIAEAEVGAALREDLADLEPRLGTAAVVRSSTDRDADPRWSGGFPTYLEVVPADLPVAVRGCWASTFGREVRARSHATGVEPDGLRMAVLIQPWVTFEAGGTAEVLADGAVRISAARARPDQVLSGRVEASTVVVTAAEDFDVGEAPGLPGSVLRSVAELARRANAATGDAGIEWGVRAGHVTLLQTRPPPARGPATAPLRPLARRFPFVAERLAELSLRYPSPLGDELVLPWATAIRELPPEPAIEIADAVAALDEAFALADGLVRRAWGPSPDARDEAARAIRAVLGPDPEAALGRWSRLRAVDARPAARLLGLVRGVARRLSHLGAITAEDVVWRLTPSDVAAAERGEAVSGRVGPGRWEPFVAAVASSNGTSWTGVPAAPGLGAGPVRFLRGSPARWTPEPRAVLAVEAPVPQLAPLLWRAAGLVAASGSPAAHVCEVARSLGVPAVVAVELPPDADGRPAAVDGGSGTVSMLARPARSSRAVAAPDTPAIGGRG